MGSQAEEWAAKSEKEIVTARMLEEAGAGWDSERGAWVFEDGSGVRFIKTPVFNTSTDGARRFSHYRIEVDDPSIAKGKAA